MKLMLYLQQACYTVCLCVSALKHIIEALQRMLHWLLCFYCKAFLLHQVFIRLFLFGRVCYCVCLKVSLCAHCCCVCVFLQVLLCTCVPVCYYCVCLSESVWVSRVSCLQVCVALPWRTLSCHSDQKAIIGVLLLWGEPPTLQVRKKERPDKNSERERGSDRKG